MAQDNSIHNNIALKQSESISSKNGNIKFKKLVPDNNIGMGIYNKVLTKSLEDLDIYNIDLTGSYGSDKSSIIQSF